MKIAYVFAQCAAIALCFMMVFALPVSVFAEEPSKVRDVYVPDTLMVNPPAVVQRIDSRDKLSGLQNEVRPQLAWFTLNDDASVSVGDQQISLTDALNACAGKVIPVLNIPSLSAAATVSQTVKDKYFDMILASASTEVLSKLFAEAITHTRLAYITDEQNPSKIVADALTSGAMIVVQKDTIRYNAEYLQQRFMSVMLMPDSENDELAVRYSVDVGANFVVLDSFEKAYEMYAAVERVAYVRRAYIIGHRGMVNKAPDNTVEGLHEAFKAGADAVEIDIWRTEDDRLICFHNSNLKGSTTVEADEPEKPINSYTLPQLQEFTLKPKGEYTECKIPTFDQMLEALSQYPDKLLVIELKDYKESADLVHKLVEQYGVRDRCVFISFGGNYLKAQQALNPTLGKSLLDSGHLPDPLECVDRYYHYTLGYPASYSPSYTITYSAVYQLHLRGVGVNMWTAQTLGQMTDMAYHGAQFITTDLVEEESWVRMYYTRMSADEIFGKYVPPVPEKTFDLSFLWIIILPLVTVMAGITGFVFAKKRKKK